MKDKIMKRLNKLGSLLLLFGMLFSSIGLIPSYIPLKSKLFGGVEYTTCGHKAETDSEDACRPSRVKENTVCAIQKDKNGQYVEVNIDKTIVSCSKTLSQKEPNSPNSTNTDSVNAQPGNPYKCDCIIYRCVKSGSGNNQTMSWVAQGLDENNPTYNMFYTHESNSKCPEKESDGKE